MPHSGTHFLSFWCDLVPKSHPSASKKGPESIIPRIVLHHWTRTMINEKNDKKRLPKNMPQNLKSRPPDRQNDDFGIDFGTLLASFFH